MSNMHTRWLVGGSLLAAMVASGCDVNVRKCKDGDDAEICNFDWDEEDAGDAGNMDGAVKDAGTDGAAADGATTDATTGDGGVDGGVADSGPGAMNIDQFCSAILSKATAWRDRFEQCCLSLNDDTEWILNESFGYDSDTSLTQCLGYDSMQAASKITVVPSKLQACADAYNAQFPAAPAECPATGFDLEITLSKYGHGLQFPVQIPACREALVGKVTLGNECKDSFECVPGYRCRKHTGQTKTCQPAADIECDQSPECVDGKVCVGQANLGGKTCVSKDQLPLTSNQKCNFTFECATDRVCLEVKAATTGSVAQFGCVTPTAGTFICKP